MAAPRRYSDEQYAQAQQLVADGASIRDAANTTGISYASLYRRVKKPDPVPGGGSGGSARSKPTARKGVATDAQLTNLFAKLATAPAIPMALVVHCDFCAAHFATNGPHAATKLVELSHDHPALRSVMENIWGYADEIAWAGVLGAWMGVPLAHHLAPDMLYRWIQLPLGLPDRNGNYAPHAHAPTNGATPGPTPFADMDLESVMRMAQSMGINIDSPIIPEPPATTETTETDSQAETPAADSDPGE